MYNYNSLASVFVETNITVHVSSLVKKIELLLWPLQNINNYFQDRKKAGIIREVGGRMGSVGLEKGK